LPFPDEIPCISALAPPASPSPDAQKSESADSKRYNPIMPKIKEIIARAFNKRIRVLGDNDPLFERLYDGRYQWLKLDNLKVSPRVHQAILAKRQLVDEFNLRYDKRLAIIIPFRNREAHLEQLLPRLREKLKQENIRHTIFVVDQCDENLFNRGKLINVGAALAGDNFDYFCLHDVDMLPLDCNYGMPSAPLRLYSSILSNEGTREVSSVCFGGMVSISRNDFTAVNGFSNKFWHWGKEDDNFLLRLLRTGLNPAVDTQGTFAEIEDSSDRHRPVVEGQVTDDRTLGETYIERNRQYQYKAARGLIPLFDEGLSSIKYELIEKTENEQYTRLRVRL
jgi:hypothetical protein